MADINSTLLVRHLPSQLTNEDKENLLFHFGAIRVKVLDNSMKHCAFATFSDEEAAKNALERLHQLEVFDKKLVIEFSRKSQQEHFPKFIDNERKPQKDDKRNSKQGTKEKTFEPKPHIDEGYLKWGIQYCANPRLSYIYPPPTVSILTNIANALASCPKFYVQVLHLMNKMNIPAPFGSVTQTPPIPNDSGPQETDNLSMEEMEVSTTEESELESDSEGQRLTHAVEPSRKRVLKKRKKLKQDWNALKQSMTESIKLPSTLPAYSARDVFDQANLQSKKISIKLPDTVAVEEPSGDLTTNMDTETLKTNEPTDLEQNSSGFGKIAPLEKPNLPVEEEEDDKFKNIQFVSTEKLRQGRISSKDMKELSVFKNYQPGEPSSRLYIKNLSRHVTEDDLWKIFGFYINSKNEDERNMFYIRLMQEGRIRGQAFITLPNEKVAKVALEDTNGFVLYNRPMVVQFARSAKQKEGEKK
ncbi:RNA-binding region-containing protein 3 [Octopus vulgaris]|uniref:RNA-binding region-containing protein 3 n=2 Tax=Octopus TaxID=6643 RepID=A0AA36B476_OCTVU|nr:RNA-binding region-containing protein 3 [Octopus sinensis]XP_029640050.1 RNA-binding region-containing protein 3 [Octopus sinensis]XP_036361118.1 RNA-binding region-containing protein 3 [Octopus sinensis]CAI9726866.1 RNA-binding region-containing protein 3 [Octopus vulgaris]